MRTDNMTFRYWLILLAFLLFPSLVTHSQNVVDKNEMSEIVRKYIGASLGVGCSIRDLSANSKTAMPVSYMLTGSLWRLSADMGFLQYTHPSNLIYSINFGASKETNYPYQMRAFNFRFGYVFKYLNFKKSKFDFSAGYSLLDMHVKNVNLQRISLLSQGYDFIQIFRMSGREQHEIYLALRYYLYLKNQEFVVRLHTTKMIASRLEILNSPTTTSNLLFHPRFTSRFELSILYDLVPLYRVNPYRMKIIR